jgi:plastocyanin
VKVEIKPLAPPPAAETPAPVTGVSGGTVQTPSASAAPTPAAETAAPAATPQPKPMPTVSSIQLHDGVQPFQGTQILGVVHFNGRAPRPRPIAMDADAYCMSAHADALPLDDHILVNADKTIQNVFVYVKDGLPAGQTFDIPADKQHPLLTQTGCMYEPHVVGMVAGQHLKILNNDNTLHNVQVSPKNNPVFNEAMPVQGMTLDKPFNKPDPTVMFKCAVHPWMTAYVHVMANPFFAVSDVQGRFEIEGLPAGTYTLEALQEDGQRIAPVDFQVTISANSSQRADVTLQPPGK